MQSDQEILIELERNWDAAFAEGRRVHRNVLADEFMVTHAEGVRADKAKELTVVAEFNQQIDSPSTNFVVNRRGLDTRVGPKQGRPLELTFRYTDVWVLRDGRWQCVEPRLQGALAGAGAGGGVSGSSGVH